jgi:hypothetical protein
MAQEGSPFYCRASPSCLSANSRTPLQHRHMGPPADSEVGPALPYAAARGFPIFMVETASYAVFL